MAASKKKNGADAMYISKKCPECYEYLSLDASVCKSCKTPVGKINKHGMASRKTEWKTNIICVLAWLAFALYIWWAFF